MIVLNLDGISFTESIFKVYNTTYNILEEIEEKGFIDQLEKEQVKY